MLWLMELWELVAGFMRQGGNILYFVALVLLIMWGCIIERLIYLNSVFPQEARRLIAKWDARDDTTSWHAHRIREAWLSDFRLRLGSRIGLIKTLVALCPLVGLLGTVTGMIDVFETMAMYGSGNPREMAGGISKATIPTMAGMVAALSGLFIASQLENGVKVRSAQLADSMPHH